MFKKKQRQRQRPSYQTGAKNSRTFSYYASPVRDTVQENGNQRIIRKTSLDNARKHIERSYIKALIAVLFMFVISYASYIDTNSVRFIMPNDNILLQDKSVYETSLRTLMNSSLKNKSKFTIDANAIGQSFQLLHPEIKAASVAFTIIGNKPIVRVTNETATLVLDTGASEVFIINAEGRVVATISKTEAESLKVPLVLDRSGVNIELGKMYLASEEVVFIRRIHAQAESTNSRIVSMMLPPLAREMHVRFADNPEIYVKFFTGGSADLQFGTYRAIATSITSLNMPKEYIDVRVGERAYTK